MLPTFCIPGFCLVVESVWGGCATKGATWSSYLKYALAQILNMHSRLTQLSVKACPNNWLPKRLKSVQLHPNITELCPAMVACFYSNLCSKYEKLGLLLLNIMCVFFIQKLDNTPNWAPLNFQFFLSLSQTQLNNLLKIGNSLFISIIYTLVHFLPILPSSLIWKYHFKFKSHIWPTSRDKKMLKVSQYVPLGLKKVSITSDHH